MTTNDPYEGLTPEEARKKFDELNKPSQNYSKAPYSNITSVDQDNSNPEGANPVIPDGPVSKKELNEILNNVANIFSEQLQKLEQVNTQRVNQLAADMQNAINQSQGHPADQKNQLIESVVDLAKDYFKQQQNPAENEFEKSLMENYKKEAIESINIVSLINKKVKASLTGKVAGTIADNVLAEAEPVVSHGP